MNLENSMTLGNAEACALMTDADEQAQEARVKALTEKTVKDTEWILATIETDSALWGALPRELATIIGECEDAILGDPIALQAVLRAAWTLRKAALPDAKAWATDMVEAE